jgi:hypothetical protein
MWWKMRTRPVALLLLLVGSACGTYDPASRVNPEQDEFGRRFVESVWTNDLEFLDQLSPRVLQVPGVMDRLYEFRSRLPGDGPGEVRLVDAGPAHGDGWRYQPLVYQLQADGQWARFALVVMERDGQRFIDRFEAQALPASMHELHALTFRGKSWTHLVFVGLAAFALLFSVAAAVRVARTRMGGRWLWVALALLGVGRVSLNWTTGQVMTQPLVVLLLPTAWVKHGPVDPWIVSFAFPIGAIVVWERCRRYRRTSDERAAEVHVA